MLLQLIGAVFFSGQILLALLGISIRPIEWQLYEIMEITAALGLSLGVIFSLILLRLSFLEQQKAKKLISEASFAFHDLLDHRFLEWKLSTAEKDVALFAIKGFSTKEIADIRQSSEGTIKAQSAAIYRKAGVKSKSQLLSLFVEDMFEGNKNT